MGRQWYYDVPKDRREVLGRRVKLGENESEAWRTWFELTGDVADDLDTLSGIIPQWWGRYAVHNYAESTLESYAEYLKPLGEAFGHMRPGAVRLVHVNKYRAMRLRQSPTGSPASGTREASVLSSILSWCAEEGLIETNVLRGMIRKTGQYKEVPRRRSPSVDELERFCEINPHLRGYVTLKLLTGLRKSQLLGINLNDQWDGKELRPQTVKGGVDTDYHGEALEIAIADILGNRLPVGPLFLNRKRKAMTRTGFDSLWQRARNRFIEDGGEHFREHDIRRTAANEKGSVEEAQRLLGHTSPKVTRAVYLTKRKGIKVEVK